MGGLNFRRCLHRHSKKHERGSSRDSLTGRLSEAGHPRVQVLAENAFKRNKEQKEEVMRLSRLKPECLASDPVT